MRYFLFLFFIQVHLLFSFEKDSIGVADIKAKQITVIPLYQPVDTKLTPSSTLIKAGDTFQAKKFQNMSGPFNPLATKINYNILAGFGVAVGTSFFIIHNDFKHTWWKKDSLYTGKFHFMNDWNYALSVDKVGHMYATHLLAHGLSGAFDAANFTTEESAWYSASLALLFELYIESEDGFAYPRWGFSPGDAAGDFLGATFYVSQYYFPYLKNFQLRWSYFPSEAERNGTHKGNITDDYEGQIYWVSARMKNLMPENISEYIPSFLNLSLGYGVRNLDGSGGGKREFYLGLDFDAEEIPLYGPVWQFIKNTLNYIHFPLPGIRITPDAKFFVFCF